MTIPRVSVVLPVYNGAAYLARSITSVLQQTYSDLELIVVDDGSTDDTARVLRSITDPRLRVLSQANCGLPRALNAGLAQCRGEYVARQDHDDLSMPTRFAEQVAYLDAHPGCGLLGTRAHIHEGDLAVGRFHDHPCSDAALRFFLLFDNPFVHSSVMMRRSTLAQLGGYATDPARQPPEDYELWSRFSRIAELANLPGHLLIYREVAGSFSRARAQPFVHKRTLSAENLAHCLGASVASADMLDIAALTHSEFDALSERPSLTRMLALVRRAARQLDPRGTNQELAHQLAVRTRWLYRQYALRSALAQRAVHHLRRLRGWTRERLR